MTLSLDRITLAVPEVSAARAFYTAVLSPDVTEDSAGTTLDMHGTGRVALSSDERPGAERGAESVATGFPGFIVSYIVPQPGEVELLLEAALRNGATVLKPAQKGFFGGFSATFRAPDGALWKVSAPTKKDTGPAARPPVPTETAVLLGVADPKASQAFYRALGMTVDRNYGRTYSDFVPAPGSGRLGLMPRRALAKDVGVGEQGDSLSPPVFTRCAETRAEVDALLAAAVSAGGRDVIAAEETEQGGYSAQFTDPDGFCWRLAHRG
ncbi:hypothetical protein GCM10022198_01650 [Klugiella xanthotipulae]|uniref:Putative lactoylglutathione lyase n=1 Tax=Klugiella xanthotipulae TaxID=244735 RepID=A0A543I542_9MICO|nr:VOC family protein [Klugiella xanthotipulae]TQM65697.1 putative lactoylglutathione lyase [Klugiella xanthotipulae]